jgi:hypothetical protein
MSETSPRLALPYLQPSQAQKHVTHNEALERLDLLTQLVVQEFDSTTPPAAPSAGLVYALGDTPTGDWAGHPWELALHTGTGWLFVPPSEGWQAWGLAEEEARVWTGSAWLPVNGTAETLGINASADLTNRLTVSATATLLTHAGAGHQLKINKASTPDTASLLFQNNWTGHAEMGLAGDTAFSVKVSADGGSWFQALRADPGSQTLTLSPDGTAAFALGGAGLTLNVPLTGSAVQTATTDATDGRLMTVGAFGLGGDAPYLSDITVTDGSIPSGFYQIDGTTAGAPHSGVQHLIQTRRSTGGGETQLALSEDDGALFLRSRSAGAWQNWQHVPSAAFLTGDMTDPTLSPVFERGQNASGAYTRFADGTQICWGRPALAYSWERDLLGNWTFPADFLTAPQVFATLDFNSFDTGTTAAIDAVSTLATENASTTQASLRLIRAAGQPGFVSGDAAVVDCLAIGRWK